MEIKTQKYLNSLDKDKNGLKVSELKALDKDNDGNLTAQEIGLKNISSKDVSEINKRYKEASIDPISKIFNFDTNNSFPKSPFEPQKPVYNGTVFSKNELNTELFPEGVSSIKASAINQSGAGDCYFLSALASLAEKRPYEIMNMVNDNGNGTYNVKLPGFDEAVTVTKPDKNYFNKEGVDYNDDGSLWPAVIEKAYLQKYDKNSIMHTLGNGIAAVTGHNSDFDWLSLTSNKTLRNKIEETLSAGRIVTASTFGDGDKDKNISSSHVYSIIGYDRKTDLITIRNPWGPDGEPKGIKNPDSTKDGVFKLTMKEFNDLFSCIAFEENSSRSLSHKPETEHIIK